MAMSLTRRDAMLLLGGSALGVVLSPVPWKLLDDVAIAGGPLVHSGQTV